MKHSQKAKYIICTCMLAIGIISAFAIRKALRPSGGDLPYESVTMEQAMEYMQFEEGYVLLDTGTPEEYTASHIQGAISIPYRHLMDEASLMLPDKNKMIYVYGRDEDTCDKASRKLCELGYINVTNIGLLALWKGKLEGTDV